VRPPSPRKHGRLDRPLGCRSWRRQPDHEARAGHRRLAFLVDRAGAVLGPDASAMGFDDLLGDGKAEARVLAKALMRTVGIEALEHALQCVGTNAGAVVIDHDLDIGADAAAMDAHL